jgi:arsenate reductase
MEVNDHARRLAALSHPGRLAAFRLLARRAPQGARPSEIAAALDVKPNTLSAHLGALAEAGLAQVERQGKSLLYRADMEAMGALVDFLVADCCGGRPALCAPRTAAALAAPGAAAAADAGRPMNVLFICTGNSARSIFAEALLREEGAGRFAVYSAGTRPRSELNPFALDVLARNGHETAGLRAKNLAEFQQPGAPVMDFVFTVCDHAANESCPPWPGQPVTAHWGLPDPVKVEGTEAEKGLAFARTYAAMRLRVQAFAALPLQTLDRIALQRAVDEIGEDEETRA